MYFKNLTPEEQGRYMDLLERHASFVEEIKCIKSYIETNDKEIFQLLKKEFESEKWTPGLEKKGPFLRFSRRRGNNCETVYIGKIRDIRAIRKKLKLKDKKGRR